MGITQSSSQNQAALISVTHLFTIPELITGIIQLVLQEMSESEISWQATSAGLLFSLKKFSHTYVFFQGRMIVFPLFFFKETISFFIGKNCK